ncbi:hypothetical protein [Citricoccus sp.]|uniref:hypothetical protein n=1 Tax=Citricoccus sp. TaxID=1978372 RepID=UPI0028BD7AC3|nr:hypothetical protein [Citricoccus sp.]
MENTPDFAVIENSLAVKVVDALTLRFTGEDQTGVALHELRAAHVAEVLQGLVGLTGDFDKAGVFHSEGPATSEVLVRPAKEGSFLMEVVRVVAENPEPVTVGTVLGVPSLSTIIWWATKSVRAEVKDFSRLENGNVKVVWQDDTAQEIPPAAWDELQKRTRRRKKQLRQIMAPLSDPRVTALDVASPDDDETQSQDDAPEAFELTRSDYAAVRPEDDIEEDQTIFEIEAQMSAIDFEDPTRWRVKTKDQNRSATVEDETFLRRVASGLAIRRNDIFRLRVREDATKKNGRTRTKWTVLKVESHRRSTNDDDS